MKTFNYKTANFLLNKGKTIRSTIWSENQYIFKMNGVIIDENGKEFIFGKRWRDSLFLERKIGGFQCQNQETETKTEISTTTEPLDRKNQLRNEGPETEKETSLQKGLKLNENDSAKNIKTTKNLESENSHTEGKVTMKTESTNLTEEKSTSKNINQQQISDKENIMSKTKNTLPQAQTKNEGNVTQQSDLLPLLTNLNAEKLGSMNLLNASSEQLLQLSKRFLMPQKVDDETGEVIQQASFTDLDRGLRCLEELRNTLKVKLDYIKVGRQIVEDIKDANE